MILAKQVLADQEQFEISYWFEWQPGIHGDVVWNMVEIYFADIAQPEVELQSFRYIIVPD